MRKVGRILFGVVLSSALITSCGESKEEKIRHQRVLEHETEVAGTISSYIQEFNADTSWISKLMGGEEFRIEVLTIELEKLWIIDKPIVIEGVIVDITTYDADNYLFELKTPFFGGHLGHGFPELHFKITYPKAKSEILFDTYPELLKRSIGIHGARLLVVATISEIEKTVTLIEGDYENIQFGVGIGYEMKPI